MLVLSRKPGQSIIIGEDIIVTVLEIHGDQVRLGIQAPKELSVHREEIYAAIKEENEAAVRSNAEMVGSLQEIFDENKDEDNKR